MRTHLVALLLLLSAGCTHAPSRPDAASSSDAVAARPEDVATIDGVMKAFYEVVNIAPDEPRQWARDRTLYSPWIHFVAIGKTLEVYDHPRFVASTEPLIAGGFREWEIHRTVKRYGNIAHVASTYEARTGPGEGTSGRGVNYLQLYFDGTRWWVASLVWQSEDAANPIPPELLPASQP
ncbi:hypothetical protein MYSTI_01802 [Myxococcus stipitatus DSM 14675]|uniref:DUF4440 domain-containing protein n=1 Tax=Myxococcus stipitatus (strain DSM 14675 / JCM 12634 / Mx s8) TaxID=1278073 RepID=L7U9J1_MYXSD|nr:hypothetical protein [Myxococcus stipitatus]AGC43134.1 hypothetical protein MYSTI_01802 [Myxococcus stipitatus DSM 14675]